MARILVTGGAGFIGSHVVDELIKDKNEAILLDDLSGRFIENVNKKARSNLGKILRPVAEVVLESKQLKVEIPMYIDSGADITMIPLRLGKTLGFKQEATDVIREIHGIGGGGIPYILKEVSYILNKKRIKGRIAWALIEEVLLLLGIMDIFNQFRVTFDEKNGWIDFL